MAVTSAVDQILVLSRQRILSELSPDQLALLASHLTLYEVEQGAIILREGDEGDEAYFLAEGQVEIFERMTLKTSRTGFEDRERTLVRLDAKKGIFFGELALFDHVSRSANVIATSPCTLLVLTRARFDDFLVQEPIAGAMVMRAIGRVLAERILKMGADIKKLTTALSIAVR